MILSKRHLLNILFQKPRILKYKLLSSCANVIGNPIISQPVQMVGKGKIIFNGKVTLGVFLSPYFYSGYTYIDARNIKSTIEINDSVWINNNAVIISEGEGISIGCYTIIGTNFQVYDSDFHPLSPNERMVFNKAATAKVEIGDNVFIGSNVTVFKGVTIGNNSVVGNGSIVTGHIPANVIAVGSPAKVIKQL